MLRRLPTRLRALVAPHAAPWAACSSSSTTGSGSSSLTDAPSTSGSARQRPPLLRRPYSAAPEQQPAEEGLVIDDSTVKRLRQLQARTPEQPVLLRVEVQGGGCSGFQYQFRIDHEATQDDRVFEKAGARVVCDPVSLGFLKGATIEFEDSLMRSAFQVAANPNSESTCGCGTSFVAKT